MIPIQRIGGRLEWKLLISENSMDPLRTTWLHGEDTQSLEQSKLIVERVPPALAEQGVKESDIKWWDGLPSEARKDIVNSMYAMNMAITKDLVERGISPEEGMSHLYKVTLLYDQYPLEEAFVNEWKGLGYTEEDYPLPWQLHNRCDKYIWEHFNSGKHLEFRKNASEFNTMNAFFRNLIRAGVV